MRAMTPLQFVARQRWLRHGIRDRLLRLLAAPEKQSATGFDAPFFGYTYRGRMDSYIDWCVYFYGAYEPALLELIRRILEGRNGVFLDVGANVGHHSLFASRYATVHAFEPFAPVRAALEEKLAMNGIKNVVVHDFGLGEKTESLPFFAPHGDNQATGSFVSGHAPTNGPDGTLRVVRGDELNLARVDLIKIDVEGFEREVLVGLRETLQRLRPLVLMEWSDTTKRAIQDAGRLAALFPAEYEFFGVENRRTWGIFERSKPSLSALDSLAEEVLAVPKEGLHVLR